MTLTFFASPDLKAAVRHRVAEHHRLDQIVQRTYWDGARGCFIGCSLHSADHFAFETLLGLPAWLAFLGERIFEFLPSGPEPPQFTLDLYDAIPVGIDPERVKLRFLRWLILDPEHGVARINEDPRVEAVGHALDAELRGEYVDWEEVGFAAYAAYNAAYAAYAAYNAARAAVAAAVAAVAAADKVCFSRAAAAELCRLFAEEPPVKGAVPSLPDDLAFMAFYNQLQSEVPQ